MPLRHKVLLPFLLTAALAATPAGALDSVTFALPGVSDDLAEALRAASLTDGARRDGRTDPQEIFGAAQADYGRLLGALYAAGHYSGSISIRIDGREAADIAPLNAPRQINRIEIAVDPGPPFTFSRAEVAPLAPRTEIPAGYRAGEPALSGVIREAAEAAVDGWREAGHAKADIGTQALTANHPQRVIDARLAVAPGPQARFGRLSFTGQQRMRVARLHKIAGLPEGEVYSPTELRRAADRLRRTGVFRSVALTEAEALGPGDTLDITAAVSEMPLRRLGFGAELTSTEGASVSAFWLHRNLLGGGERFRIAAEVSNIGAKSTGIDFSLGIELERPASFTPDTTARMTINVQRASYRGGRVDGFDFGFGLSHYFSEKLTGTAELRYTQQRSYDSTGSRLYRSISLPIGATWERRDNPLDPQRGFWVKAEAMPFIGLAGTGSGARATLDARAYRNLGQRLVFAARLQGGIVAGSDLLDLPRDYLFWSGGGGTVRGQSFRSLGVNYGAPATAIGGTRFIGGSLELRGRVTDKIGLVGFVDYGRISDPTFSAAPDPGWHAGAGLGVRYSTPVGPIRLDLAAPVGGKKASGVQFYLGIGQAF